MAENDTVVALAGKHEQLEARERADADRWATAAADPEFRREMAEISRDLRCAETRPE